MVHICCWLNIWSSNPGYNFAIGLGPQGPKLNESRVPQCAKFVKISFHFLCSFVTLWSATCGTCATIWGSLAALGLYWYSRNFPQRKRKIHLDWQPGIAQESLSKEACFHWCPEIFLSSFKCRRKTGAPVEKLAEASLDWKPIFAHTAPGPASNLGCIGA